MIYRFSKLDKSILILLTVSCFYSCTTPEERGKQVTSTVKEPGKRDTVVIQQMKFTPAALEVNEGDTVTWINKDILDHNVTEETNNEWTSGTLSPGKSWNMVISKNASYFCSIHPVMKGKLNVR